MDRLPSADEMKGERASQHSLTMFQTLITPSHSLSLAAQVDERNERMRQQWIKTYEARLVAAEISKCQKAEGVNHYAVCRPIVETYLDLLKDAKVRASSEMTRLRLAADVDVLAPFIPSAPAHSQVKGYRIIDEE